MEKQINNLIDVSLIVCGLLIIGFGLFLIWLTITTRQTMERAEAQIKSDAIILDYVDSIKIIPYKGMPRIPYENLYPSRDAYNIDTLQDGTIHIYPKVPPPDYTTSVDAGYTCKHCGEPLFRQQGGAWVHATFDDGGYISCQDHRNKKFDQNREGDTYAEPSARL